MCSVWAIVIDQCPASTHLSVNNYLKNLLLWNRPTDLNKFHRNDPYEVILSTTNK